MAEGNLFDAVGVGLGRHEMYAVAMAIKQLGEDPKRGLKSIRFFGKFLGLYNDYYVYEVQYKTAPEVPDAPGASACLWQHMPVRVFLYRALPFLWVVCPSTYSGLQCFLYSATGDEDHGYGHAQTRA